ncbi:MAG: hypothetical protein FH749_11625 [Firmicutes bacterium]|nr:hypothetical protein [Bacillota bacterium]
MFTAVRKYSDLLLLNFKLNLASAMEYRFSFWSQVLFMMLNNLFLLFFWWVFFSQFALPGWDMSDILLLYSLVSGSFGIAAMLAGNSTRLGEIIARGELDYYLLLPINPLFNVLTSRLQVSAAGDLAFALMLAPIALNFDLASVALFLALLCCGALVLTAFWTSAGCLSFFWGYSQGLASLVRDSVVMFSTYPEAIFSGGIRFMLFTIIPAGFVTHLPLTLLREFSWLRLGVLLAATALLLSLACWLFHAGLKRYESGNLMVTRV